MRPTPSPLDFYGLQVIHSMCITDYALQLIHFIGNGCNRLFLNGLFRLELEPDVTVSFHGPWL
jgi:hypothetical protein